MFGLEVGGDACGSFAEHPHVALEVLLQGLLIPRGRLPAKRCLEVPIEILVGIAFGTVGGQEHQLDAVALLRHLGLHRCAVVHSQVVHNQNHFAARVLGQATEKIDEHLPVETVAINHPAHLPHISRPLKNSCN